jgi:hypothetical protein
LRTVEFTLIRRSPTPSLILKGRKCADAKSESCEGRDQLLLILMTIHSETPERSNVVVETCNCT